MNLVVGYLNVDMIGFWLKNICVCIDICVCVYLYLFINVIVIFVKIRVLKKWFI